jgi:hypothetical protein
MLRWAGTPRRLFALRVVLALFGLLLAGGTIVACGAPARDGLARKLAALGDADARGLEAHTASLLAAALASDAYRCTPAAEQVLGTPPNAHPDRRIRGRMPHYGLYHGPMRYRVAATGGRRPVWLVRLNIALDAEQSDRPMELPDCALRSQLSGELRCEGTPYEQAPGLEACPDSGRFEAPASRANLRALLRRWSREAEAYFNRDAERYGLAVRYDFELFLADDPQASELPVDVRMPLWSSCGRSPYFAALRSGWSIPVLAHELGHFLGLLDEYQALSGIVGFYPKTPYEGSENSRMGVSMKTHTRLYPLHHYLVLRRFHCAEPDSRDPYADVFGPGPSR